MYLIVILGPLVIAVLYCLIFNFLDKKILFISLFIALLITLFISVLLVLEVVFFFGSCFIELQTWFKLGALDVKWSFFFDKLSTLMLFLIIFISFLVHIFAFDYLNNDPHLGRFLVLLTLFTIFMELLVTSGNLVQFFLGWESVGLMSYVLINFWFSRYSATNAGLMAIIYNRFGDSSLLLGIALMCFILETTDFISLVLLTKLSGEIQIQLFYNYFSFIDILTLLLFIGVIGKSAQIFLESWLASAMEGPTPVSSLLHASTMIVSGVFLLQRFQPYILCSVSGMLFITFVGALTAFFAGTIGLVSMDLKRIIAYSTCSQMGYLVFSVGIGNTNASFFHLINHAFFKCLLFVSAGSIIHALMNEQDIRKMGGLFKIFPFTYILMLVASLSLMGLPFLSGFYSKEKLLLSSFYLFNFSNFFGFWFAIFNVNFTSIYSLRLLFYTFFFKPQNYKLFYKNIHTDIKSYLNIVLFILGLGAIFSGFFLEDLIIGLGNDWLILTSLKLKIYNIDLQYGLFSLNILAILYTFLGMILSFIIFLNKALYNIFWISLLNKKNTGSYFFKHLFIFFSKRWFLNLSYNRYIASSSFLLGYNQTFFFLDKGLFEIPTILSVRYISSLYKSLYNNIIKFLSLREILVYFFFIYPLFLLLNFFSYLSFCFAVPRKKVRAKKKKNMKPSSCSSLPLKSFSIFTFIKNQ